MTNSKSFTFGKKYFVRLAARTARLGMTVLVWLFSDEAYLFHDRETNFRRYEQNILYHESHSNCSTRLLFLFCRSGSGPDNPAQAPTKTAKTVKKAKADHTAQAEPAKKKKSAKVKPETGGASAATASAKQSKAKKAKAKPAASEGQVAEKKTAKPKKEKAATTAAEKSAKKTSTPKTDASISGAAAKKENPKKTTAVAKPKAAKTAPKTASADTGKDVVLGKDVKGRTIYQGPKGGQYYIKAVS